MPEGEYNALLVVKDVADDFWLGDVNHAYSLVSIPVVESTEPQITGKIVFIAPGLPDPNGFPGAANVWLMDLDIGIETQLTAFAGVGYLFHEPRINPAGTHHLHCAGPTPYYSNVRVYEFGGSNWTITTDEVDDYADFHPDGIHIVTASGDQWGDTPDLYMMEYDGSNRVKIATAPDTVQNPAVSPDGKFIAMTLGMNYSDPPSSELWLYDVEQGIFSEIMPAPGVDLNPGWSPVLVDGEQLLIYASSRDHYPDYELDIYIINPFTQEIIYHYDSGLNLYDEHPSFSPDGLSFVFDARKDNELDSELFIYSWKTEELIQITDDDMTDWSPHWCWGW
jgi:Tol biopolymer transport system component